MLDLLGSTAAIDFLLPTEDGDNIFNSDQATVLQQMIRTNLTPLPHSLLQEKRAVFHIVFSICAEIC